MKIIIADDEKYVRNVLVKSINWKSLGISGIMQANDGNEALEIAAWFRPDIVLTDVKMPKLDGIKLAEKLIEIQPDIKIIFISSYLEIPLLKKAIQLAAVDYIEKPIDISNLELVLKKSILAIKKEIYYKEELSKNRNWQKQIYAIMLTYPYANEDNKLYDDLCNKMNIAMDYQYFVSLIVQSENALDIDEIENKLYQQNMFCICGRRNPGQYVVILGFKEFQSQLALESLARRLLSISGILRVAIGAGTDSVKGLAGDYSSASESLQRAFFKPNESIFCTVNKSEVETIDFSIIQEFSRLINGEYDKLLELAEKIYKDINVRNYKREQVEALYYSLCTILIDKKPELTQYLMLAKEGEVNKENLWKYIRRTESIHELHNILQEILENGLALLSEKESLIIRDAKNILQRDFACPQLGIVELAKKVGLTSTYLSTLFKRETGVSPKKYLTDCRINHAKRMLKDTKLKINEIATKCGYYNDSYFVNVFKQEVGCTPSEYREKMR